MANSMPVTVIHSNDAWAVGWYVTGDGTSTAGQTLIEHWDGRAWSIVASLRTRS